MANAPILYSGLKRLPKLFKGQSLGRGRGGLASDPTSPPTVRVGSCSEKSKGLERACAGGVASQQGLSLEGAPDSEEPGYLPGQTE